MKNNIKELIDQIVTDVLNGKEGERVNIDDIIDECVPLLTSKPGKMFLLRFWLRSRITSAFNAHEIYSCNTGTVIDEDGNESKEQGYFIALNNANTEQLTYFQAKYEGDLKGVARRGKKINDKLGQISMLINEKNEIEISIPEAVNL